MITIIAGKEPRAISARENLRAALTDAVQRLELSPPTFRDRSQLETQDSRVVDKAGANDERRHVILLDLPESLLPELAALLRREGVAEDPLDSVRPTAPEASPPLRHEDEAYLLRFRAEGPALTHQELRRWAATGEWPARAWDERS